VTSVASERWQFPITECKVLADHRLDPPEGAEWSHRRHRSSKRQEDLGASFFRVSRTLDWSTHRLVDQ
jgi:hypothetical protein